MASTELLDGPVARAVDSGLPAGVRLRPLVPHRDERGVFLELFRESWLEGQLPRPVQWNCVSSAKGVLRGVHVHVRHDDFLTVPIGRCVVALRDLRPGSATVHRTATVMLSADRPRALWVPHGVAHGFWFPEPSVHIYAVSEYFDSADELGCRWNDPELELDWQLQSPLLSDRDATAPSFASLRREFERRWQTRFATPGS